MRKILFILSATLMVTAASAQTNTSVRGAHCTPNHLERDTIKLESSPNCINGDATVFYQFYVPASATVGVAIADFSVNSGTFSYLLYGPFETLEEGYSQVETGTAPVVASSVTAGNSQTIPGGAIVAGKVYLLELKLSNCNVIISGGKSTTYPFVCHPAGLTCDDCLGQFQPSAGTYVFSAWTKEEGAAVTKTTYTQPVVRLEITDGITPANYSFTPIGEIIDGWQQITGVFDVPTGMTSFELTFEVDKGSALFDDIRIFPFDGSMMSYVYDPKTLRLMAELDERNYAKLYEYDEEGKLVRVKKETEKGIMTITDTRENTVKKP